MNENIYKKINIAGKWKVVINGIKSGRQYINQARFTNLDTFVQH